ncbi:hypothetical protein ebA443 [Aromatoleum aromaticum EbN1]|uniref:Uncharacterized protein n=1 Tax=Aromatoleum aromaticum (strain DSM 19018 / LMG 30748 / EbN1) TaxID=76114 RepID=Q5P8K6_AROAE|nr:hypothetical protein ebA443 [Aromatoleum aromaticum EbN1]
MTRATKQAGTKAIPLLATAIENLSMQDAKGTLSGDETAATEYFRRTTSDQLTQKLLPLGTRATGRVGLAEKYRPCDRVRPGVGVVEGVRAAWRIEPSRQTAAPHEDVGKGSAAQRALNSLPRIDARIAVGALEIDEAQHAVALPPMQRTAFVARELLDQAHQAMPVGTADQRHLDHAARIEALHAQPRAGAAGDPQREPAGGEHFAVAGDTLVEGGEHGVDKGNRIGHHDHQPGLVEARHLREEAEGGFHRGAAQRRKRALGASAGHHLVAHVDGRIRGVAGQRKGLAHHQVGDGAHRPRVIVLLAENQQRMQLVEHAAFARRAVKVEVERLVMAEFRTVGDRVADIVGADVGGVGERCHTLLALERHFGAVADVAVVAAVRIADRIHHDLGEAIGGVSQVRIGAQKVAHAGPRPVEEVGKRVGRGLRIEGLPSRPPVPLQQRILRHDLEDHRVDDAHRPHRHEGRAEHVVVVVNGVRKAWVDPPQAGRVGDVRGRFDPVMHAAGADQIEGADRVGERRTIEVTAVRPGREGAGDGLARGTAHRPQRAARALLVEEGVEKVEGHAGFDEEETGRVLAVGEHRGEKRLQAAVERRRLDCVTEIALEIAREAVELRLVERAGEPQPSQRSGHGLDRALHRGILRQHGLREAPAAAQRAHALALRLGVADGAGEFVLRRRAILRGGRQKAEEGLVGVDDAPVAPRLVAPCPRARHVLEGLAVLGRRLEEHEEEPPF